MSRKAIAAGELVVKTSTLLKAAASGAAASGTLAFNAFWPHWRLGQARGVVRRTSVSGGLFNHRACGLGEPARAI